MILVNFLKVKCKIVIMIANIINANGGSFGSKERDIEAGGELWKIGSL